GAVGTSQVAQPAFVTRDVSLLEHHVDVVNPYVSKGALKQTRFANRGHQRRIAPEAAAVDADAITVGIPLPDRPVGGIQDVVLDALAPLHVACILECPAIAAGAAIVDLQYRIAAIRE